MLYGLQVGRGIAALLVVLHHATLGSEQFYGLPFHGFFEFGYIGVDFFFVLSGFIIYYIHNGDKPDFKHWSVYIRKRVIRIYAPYLLISVVLLLAYQFTAIQNRDVSQISVLSSLFLLPSNGSPALSVAWTLIHEVIFYIVFSLYYLSRRVFWIALLSWCILAIGIELSDMQVQRVWTYFVSLHNLEFVLGVVVAWLVVKRPELTGKFRLAFLPAIFMLTLFSVLFVNGIDENEKGLEIVVLALGFFLLVAWICYHDLYSKPVYPRFAIFLGAASYSIYLIHNPLISVLNRVYPLSGLGADAIFVAVVFSCIVAGAAYYYAIERPALKIAGRLLLSKRMN